MITDIHRPWPVPRTPWLLRQIWRNVLIAHWPVPESAMRALLPDPLRPHLETHDGSAWLGLFAFHATGTRMKGLPVIPGLSDFLELNVRTYVSIDEKPGVYFFSLDTAHLLACAGARAVYSLPYYPASMDMTSEGGGRRFRSARWWGRAAGPSFEARYAPVGPSVSAAAEAFTEFSIERYCLYSVTPRNRVIRGEINHRPWELRAAEARILRNSMAAPLGLDLSGRPICHFSDYQEAFVWAPQDVRLRRQTLKAAHTTV